MNFNTHSKLSVAYFSMEIGLDSRIPSYAGGLGILAGDTLKAALDLRIDMIGVTLLYKQGYFRQKINSDGEQIEEPEIWDYASLLSLMPVQPKITIAGETVFLKVWRYSITKPDCDHLVHVYFLDTDVEGNSDMIRSLSSRLYPTHNQLLQEIVLGIGGIQCLNEMGYGVLDNYHLNETHASLAILGLLNKMKEPEKVKERVCFTTHTPLAGGHERWKKSDLHATLSETFTKHIPPHLWERDEHGNDILNMAKLCLNFSKYANGVALKHQSVSQQMYPQYPIKAVTNGIHSSTWASPHFVRLFDEYIPQWSDWAFNLRQVLKIPDELIIKAHKSAKSNLSEYINTLNIGFKYIFDPEVFTIGFARRAASYKRHNFIFTDMDRLESIASKHGGLQLVFAGKAYPTDNEGKKIIQQIHDIAQQTSGAIRIFYIPDYSIETGRLITSGVDIWLNNPLPPLEASGTSGMKASLNGVPNFSILDGWWIEGCIEDTTGWAIGELCEGDRCTPVELEDLYTKLDTIIIPAFHDASKWAHIMKQSIAINGSYFNTHRMLVEYISEAYIQ